MKNLFFTSTGLSALILLGMAVFCYAPAEALATYTYEGLFFNETIGVYTTNDRITGYFTLNNYVPLNTPLTDVTADLVDYSFTDGQNVFDLSNPSFYLQDFRIGTDALGKITDADIFLTNHPTTCGPTNVCLSIQNNRDYGRNGTGNWARVQYSPGFQPTWTGGPAINAVPEPATLLLLSGGLFGLIPLRKKRT